MDIEVIVKDDSGNIVKDAMVIVFAGIKKNDYVGVACEFNNVKAWGLQDIAKIIENQINKVKYENI